MGPETVTTDRVYNQYRSVPYYTVLYTTVVTGSFGTMCHKTLKHWARNALVGEFRSGAFLAAWFTAVTNYCSALPMDKTGGFGSFCMELVVNLL